MIDYYLISIYLKRLFLENLDEQKIKSTKVKLLSCKVSRSLVHTLPLCTFVVWQIQKQSLSSKHSLRHDLVHMRSKKQIDIYIFFITLIVKYDKFCDQIQPITQFSDFCNVKLRQKSLKNICLELEYFAL